MMNPPLSVFRCFLGLGLVVLGLALAGPAMGQVLEPVPGAAAQAEAKKLVDEVYADLLAARTDEDRAAAARVLIMRADETDSNPAAKYILYDAARSLAVQAGDTDAAMDALNGLMNSFKDDSGGFLGVASASLQMLSRKARSDTEYAKVAQAGMAIAEKMIAAQRLTDAMDLVTRLRSAAMRSQRPELVSTYKEVLDELRAVRDEADRIAADLKAIEQNPDDPALNLSVGRYLALFRGDWEAGLAMLAKSSDEALAEAAKADLAGPRDTKGQIAVGDQWWLLASTHSQIEAQRLKDRARHWYRAALPAASGIERSLLTKRLEPAGQVKWGDLVLEPGIRTWIVVDGDEAGARPGPLAKEATWEFNKKPAGAKKTMTLHFEGYLYFPRTAELGLMAYANGSLSVEVNGHPALRGNARNEAPVQLIKGYNVMRGSILISVSKIDNPDVLPNAYLSLTELDGKPIAIPAEHWFHDATR